MKHRCPICRRTVELSVPEQFEGVKYFPFCSQRCKLIDLGGWLDAEYKITSGLQQPNRLPDISSDNPSGSL